MVDVNNPDPVLERFKAALADLYGDQLDRVVLFGSRARGDQRHDSDYDVAVFLKTLSDRWTEFDRLALLRVQLIDEQGNSLMRSRFRRAPMRTGRR